VLLVIMEARHIGLFQLASYLPTNLPNGKSRPNWKKSPLLSYINQSIYKDKFFGLVPATPQWDSLWMNIASSYSTNFIADQYAYAKTNYYDILLSKLKTVGLDLSKFGPRST